MDTDRIVLKPLTTREPGICRCGHTKASHVAVPGSGAAVRCIRWRWLHWPGLPNVKCRCVYFYAPSGGLLEP